MPDRSMGDLDRVLADYGSLLWLALLAAFLLLLLLHLRLQAQVSRMSGHYARLLRGGSGRGLEDVLERHLDRMETTAERVEQIEELCQQLEGTLQRAIQRVGIVRFNPFS